MTGIKVGAQVRRVRKKPFERARPIGTIAAMLAELAELEKATRPSDGAKSAQDKDKKALRSLEVTSHLVRAVAGWAIDHQLGLALQRLSSVRQTKEPVSNRQYLSAELAKVNTHDHEIAGATLPADPLPPAVARRALLNLLETDPGGFRAAVTFPTKMALRALEFNEVLPILQPQKNKRKVTLSKLRLQRMAVLFVEYRVARGMKRYVAVERVADAFNIGTDTLRSWKSRLRKEFGALDLESGMAQARSEDATATGLFEDRSLNFTAKSYVKKYSKK